MKSKLLTLTILGLMIFLLPRGAKAVELITNGGFESNFTGWTVINVTTNVWFNWQATAANCNACIDAWTNGGSSPHTGTRSAWNGWAAGNPVPDAYRLRQDITIPNNPGELVKLSWWQRLQWNLAFQSGSTLPQYVIVNVLNPSNNAVLQELYRFTAPAASQGPMTPPGPVWTQRVASLTPYKGQTVRIEIMCTVAQNTMGPGICEFDDISAQNFAPTSASATVAGRVLTSFGMGIGKIQVTMTDAGGNVRTALTNPFGYYNFEGVPVGSTYILTVNHKQYLFSESPRVISVNDNILDSDFHASP